MYLDTILVAMLGRAMAGARAPDYSSWFGLFNVPQIASPNNAAANAYEERRSGCDAHDQGWHRLTIFV
jgi:hypothetical protein